MMTTKSRVMPQEQMPGFCSVLSGSLEVEMLTCLAMTEVVRGLFVSAVNLGSMMLLEAGLGGLHLVMYFADPGCQKAVQGR